MYPKQFFSCVLPLLSALLFFASCPDAGAARIEQAAAPASMGGRIIIGSHYSTAPEESAEQPFTSCLRQKFDLPGSATLVEARVANYLSRFYSYTDAFSKARRCDSFFLKYHPDTGEEERGAFWQHIALFTFDNHGLVEQIRRLEQRDDAFFRVKATDGRPGELTFKAGTEKYRIFFAHKQVIFFFSAQDVPVNSDQHAAALLFKDCLLAKPPQKQ